MICDALFLYSLLSGEYTSNTRKQKNLLNLLFASRRIYLCHIFVVVVAVFIDIFSPIFFCSPYFSDFSAVGTLSVA